MASSQHPRQHAVKVFDREILAHVTVGAGAQSGMHMLFVVTHPGENDDRDGDIDIADKGNERDPIDLWHLEVDNNDFAIVVSQPGSGLEAFGKRFAAMSFLPEISDQKASDARVIIDDKKLK